ncbi:hypothetical protein ACFOJ6_04410 [Gordonia humi]|uniref:hypothetical protein n=1 Tax=Gordonia humi TaxID=686429 RepID=UPI00360F9730
MVSLAGDLTTMTGGPLLASYVVDAYSRAYPDVRAEDYLKVQARLPMRAMAARCLHQPAATVSVIEALILGDDPYAQPPNQGPLAARLTQNTPSAELTMPVFLAQGAADPLINPQGQRQYVAAQCATGSTVQFTMYPGLGHLDIVDPDSPPSPTSSPGRRPAKKARPHRAPADPRRPLRYDRTGSVSEPPEAGIDTDADGSPGR